MDSAVITTSVVLCYTMHHIDMQCIYSKNLYMNASFNYHLVAKLNFVYL